MNDSDVVYLDYAAATPLDDTVLEAMLPYLRSNFYNPSSPYAPAVLVKHDLEEARHQIATIIGTKPAEIVFTAGATESINLALTAATGGHMITANIEHDAVLKSAKNYDHTIIAANQFGRVVSDDIARALNNRTRLISIAYANHELGTIQDIKAVAELVMRVREDRRERANKTPLWLHIDASQCAGLLDISVARLGVDMMTLNAAKIYGPKQVGLLYARSDVELRPIIFGGGQESGLRSGTENVANIIGFAKALEIANRKRKTESHRLSQLRDSMLESLTKAFDDIVVSGDSRHQLPNFLHVSFPSVDAERLVFALESRGVLVATGSACSANFNTRSHVLEAIQLPPATADGSLRITLGRQSDGENIERATRIIIDVVQAEYARMSR